MYLIQLQAEIGRLLNDPNNTRWSTSILTTRINLAQTIIQGYTKAVKTVQYLTPTASQNYVNLSSGTMDIVRVAITRADGSIVPLNGITREELDFTSPNWQQAEDGEPETWFYDATNQAIYLVPAPDAANAIANGLIVWESLQPTELSSPTDIPFDSNNQMVPFHMAIVHWVVAQCWEDDGTPESLTKAHFHKSGSMDRPGEFENVIKRIMNEFDRPASVPTRILWLPEGGRASGNALGDRKANPFL